MNLIEFEWKLIVRNKRLRQLFIVSKILLPLIIYFQFVNSDLLKGSFLLREFLLWGIFALSANFATFAFSFNATFIEKQLIAPLPVFKLLQAKYRFSCIVSIGLFIAFLPGVFLGIKFIELVAAFLFSVGFVFFCLFWTSLFAYKPFDIKASYFSNYQGYEAGSYFFPMLALLVAFGLNALCYWLFNETVTLITLSFIGLVFIATNSIWLEKISKSFEKTKYRRLERFREK